MTKKKRQMDDNNTITAMVDYASSDDEEEEEGAVVDRRSASPRKKRGGDASKGDRRKSSAAKKRNRRSSSKSPSSKKRRSSPTKTTSSPSPPRKKRTKSSKENGSGSSRKSKTRRSSRSQSPKRLEKSSSKGDKRDRAYRKVSRSKSPARRSRSPARRRAASRASRSRSRTRDSSYERGHGKQSRKRKHSRSSSPSSARKASKKSPTRAKRSRSRSPAGGRRSSNVSDRDAKKRSKRSRSRSRDKARKTKDLSTKSRNKENSPERKSRRKSRSNSRERDRRRASDKYEKPRDRKTRDMSAERWKRRSRSRSPKDTRDRRSSSGRPRKSSRSSRRDRSTESAASSTRSKSRKSTGGKKTAKSKGPILCPIFKRFKICSKNDKCPMRHGVDDNRAIFQEKPAAPASPTPQAGTDITAAPSPSPPPSPSASPAHTSMASPSPEAGSVDRSHSPSPPAPRSRSRSQTPPTITTGSGSDSDTEMNDGGEDRNGEVASDSKMQQRGSSKSPSRSPRPPSRSPHAPAPTPTENNLDTSVAEDRNDVVTEHEGVDGERVENDTTASAAAAAGPLSNESRSSRPTATAAADTAADTQLDTHPDSHPAAAAAAEPQNNQTETATDAVTATATATPPTKDMDTIMSTPKEDADAAAAAGGRSVSTSPRHSPTPSRSRSPNSSRTRTMDERSRSRSPRPENGGENGADAQSYRPSFDEVRGQKSSPTADSAVAGGDGADGDGAVNNEGDQSQASSNQAAPPGAYPQGPGQQQPPYGAQQPGQQQQPYGGYPAGQQQQPPYGAYPPGQQPYGAYPAGQQPFAQEAKPPVTRPSLPPAVPAPSGSALDLAAKFFEDSDDEDMTSAAASAAASSGSKRRSRFGPRAHPALTHAVPVDVAAEAQRLAVGVENVPYDAPLQLVGDFFNNGLKAMFGETRQLVKDVHRPTMFNGLIILEFYTTREVQAAFKLDYSVFGNSRVHVIPAPPPPRPLDNMMHQQQPPMGVGIAPPQLPHLQQQPPVTPHGMQHQQPPQAPSGNEAFPVQTRLNGGAQRKDVEDFDPEAEERRRRRRANRKKNWDLGPSEAAQAVIAKINAAQAAGVGAANPAAPKTLTKGFMDPESHGIVGLNPMAQLSAMQPAQPKLLPNGMPAPRKPKRPMNHAVLVGNLPQGAEPSDVKTLFDASLEKTFGVPGPFVLDCRYVAIGTMCLAFGSQRDADAAVNLNHVDFAGTQLSVREMLPEEAGLSRKEKEAPPASTSSSMGRGGGGPKNVKSMFPVQTKAEVQPKHMQNQLEALERIHVANQEALHGGRMSAGAGNDETDSKEGRDRTLYFHNVANDTHAEDFQKYLNETIHNLFHSTDNSMPQNYVVDIRPQIVSKAKMFVKFISQEVTEAVLRLDMRAKFRGRLVWVQRLKEEGTGKPTTPTSQSSHSAPAPTMPSPLSSLATDMTGSRNSSSHALLFTRLSEETTASLLRNFLHQRIKPEAPIHTVIDRIIPDFRHGRAVVHLTSKEFAETALKLSGARFLDEAIRVQLNPSAGAVSSSSHVPSSSSRQRFRENSPGRGTVKQANEMPTEVVRFVDILSVRELMNYEDYAEITKDIEDECRDNGDVVSMHTPKPTSEAEAEMTPGVGNIYVEFSSVPQAYKARKALHGRQYAGAKVLCDFFPLERYKSRDF